MSKFKYLGKYDLGRLFRALYADGNQNHHMVALTCFRTGARVSQVFALRGTDVFEHEGRMKVQIGAAKKGHDGLHGLHLNPSAPHDDMTPLIEMARRAGPNRIFTGDRWSFDAYLKRVGTLAGINIGFLHSHMFRHSAAMVIYDHDGVKRPGPITEFLQHSSPMSAMPYLAENDGRLAQAAMDAFSLA